MKKHIKTLRLGFMAVLTALLSTSCQDWLTIYPQTQIVEQNFWEDKNDLEGVRYATYKQMCGTLESMVLWGDLRSDTYQLSDAEGQTATHILYDEIRTGMIDRDSASAYFKWDGFYTTINYCNKVISHGQEVLDIDKQFTSAEWRYMKAEMVTLRVLNYFYLLRAFKDIPYTTKVINNDAETEYFSATNQLVVLDSIITDLESVRWNARKQYSQTKDTKGMITKTAIYALLSDLYLWRASLHQGRGIMEDVVYLNNHQTPDNINNIERDEAGRLIIRHSVENDYKLAIAYADTCMAELYEQNHMNGFTTNRANTISYGLDNVEMYKNDFANFKSGGVDLSAYYNIFTLGNSNESIFELQFNKSDSRTNGVITSQWGYNESVHLAVSESALQAAGITVQDSRYWFNAWKKVSHIGGTEQKTDLSQAYCFKWRDASFRTPDTGLANETKVATSGENDSYHNWIIYRLSDVMLQKAEALACLHLLTKTAAYKDEAIRILNANHRRWYCPNYNEQELKEPSEDVMDNFGRVFSDGSKNTVGNVPAASDVEIAVLNERQIEFIAEGKRWFDLVRYAERHAGGENGSGEDVRESTEERRINSGYDGMKLMAEKFLKNTFPRDYTTLIARMKNRYGLYNIIYYMEIKASVDGNGVAHLEQNPVWNKNTYER
ncbi:MAG: RagB/SusD family nutrient uptake outer membrane protein [Bacteroidales bacterium]|nr:RagB/SusD family nutrient uptake outer membrane protein [Candidatus Physcousia equi]